MPRPRFVAIALLCCAGVLIAAQPPPRHHQSTVVVTERAAEVIQDTPAEPSAAADGRAIAEASQQAAVALWNETEWNDAVWANAVAENQRAEAAAAKVAATKRPAGPGTPTGPSSDPAPRRGGSAEDAIRRYFGSIADQALGVAQCESSMDPSAVSGGNYGLFQINSVHRDAFEAVTGQPWSAVLDPYANAQYARELYDEQGWGPWACRWAA